MDERINVVRGIDETKREFADVDDLIEWTKSVYSQFDWVLGNRRSHSEFEASIRDVVSEMRGKVTNYEQRQAKHEGDEGDEQEFISSMNNYLQNYSTRVKIFPEHPYHQYVLKNLVEDYGLTARYFMDLAVDRHVAGNDDAQIIAIIHWHLYIYDVDGKMQSQSDSVSELQSEFGKLIGNAKRQNTNGQKSFKRLEKQLDDLGNAGIEQLRDNKIQMENALAEHDAAIVESLDTADKRIHVFENTVREKIALSHPIEYWEGKKKVHEDRAKWQFIWFGASLVWVFVIMASFHATWIKTIMESEAPYSIAFLIIGIGGVFVWPLRILAKIAIGNLHQATDFDERATLIKTYISFLENEYISEDPHYRLLVLQSIFRPSSTGLVKDVAPHNVLIDTFGELLNKTKPKPSSGELS